MSLSFVLTTLIRPARRCRESGIHVHTHVGREDILVTLVEAREGAAGSYAATAIGHHLHRCSEGVKLENDVLGALRRFDAIGAMRLRLRRTGAQGGSVSLCASGQVLAYRIRPGRRGSVALLELDASAPPLDIEPGDALVLHTSTVSLQRVDPGAVCRLDPESAIQTLARLGCRRPGAEPIGCVVARAREIDRPVDFASPPTRVVPLLDRSDAAVLSDQASELAEAAGMGASRRREIALAAQAFAGEVLRVGQGVGRLRAFAESRSISLHIEGDGGPLRDLYSRESMRAARTQGGSSIAAGAGPRADIAHAVVLADRTVLRTGDDGRAVTEAVFS